MIGIGRVPMMISTAASQGGAEREAYQTRRAIASNWQSRNRGTFS